MGLLSKQLRLNHTLKIPALGSILCILLLLRPLLSPLAVLLGHPLDLPKRYTARNDEGIKSMTILVTEMGKNAILSGRQNWECFSPELNHSIWWAFEQCFKAHVPWISRQYSCQRRGSSCNGKTGDIRCTKWRRIVVLQDKQKQHFSHHSWPMKMNRRSDNASNYTSHEFCDDIHPRDKSTAIEATIVMSDALRTTKFSAAMNALQWQPFRQN